MSKVSILLALMVSGCATADDRGHLRALLAPLCIFNCVVDVIYAPGVDELRGSTLVAPQVNH